MHNKIESNNIYIYIYVCIFWVIYYYCKGVIGSWEWYLPYSIKAKKQEYLLGKIKFRSEKGKRIIFFLRRKRF